MKRISCRLLALFLSATVFSSAQDLHLPRDTNKLIDRAQKFYAAITSNQRLRALDFVLPEKRELFLSGSPMPILKAKLVGLDLTTTANQAVVRVSAEVFSKESAAGSLTWTIADKWIWKGDNWYLDVESAQAIFPSGRSESPLDAQTAQDEIDRNFQILRDNIDLGTLTPGQHFSVEVPIRYTGKQPLSLELDLPNPLVALGSMPEPITSDSKSFLLLVGADNWDGPFTLPLPLKLRYANVVVERRLVVNGSVFVPVAFRQIPTNFPLEPGREFSVFIRNNTDQEAAVAYISVDAKLDIVKQPKVLPPHEEVEVVFKLRFASLPDRLSLQLEMPIEGRNSYTYPFRNVRH